MDPPPGDGTEVDPCGVIGTVVHPPGDGTEVDPLVAGAGSRVDAEEGPLAVAAATPLSSEEAYYRGGFMYVLSSSKHGGFETPRGSKISVRQCGQLLFQCGTHLPA